MTTSKTMTATLEAPASATQTWNDVKSTRDVIEIAKYKSENPDSQYMKEIESALNKAKDEEFANMLKNPSRYSQDYLENLLKYDVFTLDELSKAGLVTSKSMESLKLNTEYLPDLDEIQKESKDQQIVPPGVDVFFFGMPTAGKTSLLMGISAANGQGYTLDMRTNGGPYAAALRQYAHAGRTPGRTMGKFVTSVSGVINSENENGKVSDYPVNLIEMSGEEFALRIAETKETNIAAMGTAATNLLRNDNRKVFFILVDASKPMVKFSYLDREIEDESEISKYVRSRYISQLDILDKFVALISQPENQEIMNKVDAINFIVTKGEFMGDGQERDAKAAELVETQYLSVVEQLKNYCRHTKRINREYDYEPQILTYSLGKFYLGDVFEYNSTDALKIVDAIRGASQSGNKYKWRKFVNTCRMFLL